MPHRGEAEWQIARASSTTDYIWGYARKASYLPGEEIELHVSTTAAAFRATLWRFDAVAANGPFVLVSSVDAIGESQSGPNVDSATGMVELAWRPLVSIDLPADAPSGPYLVRLASSDGVQSYVPIVVRSPSPHRFLYVIPSFTWQAYNAWGGTSLYVSAVPGRTRATSISFDRPYLRADGAGALFGFADLAVIAWLQRHGDDVAYTTDHDLSVSTAGHWLPRAVIIGTHSEYWSMPMRLWLQRRIYRDGRFGLLHLGANAGFWACSMLAEGRIATCPKRRSRDLFRSSVIGMPEQRLFGSMYGVISVGGWPYRLTKAAADYGLLRGTGLVPGASLGPIAGGEVDQRHPGDCAPIACERTRVVAIARVIQRTTNCSCPYNAVPETAHAVARRLPNGRRVFSAGSLYFGWALDPAFASEMGVPAGVDRFFRNLMAFVSA